MTAKNHRARTLMAGEELRRAIDMYDAGTPILAIAHELGRATQTVRTSLIAVGVNIKKRSDVQRSTKPLSQGEIDRILAFRDAGWTIENIARRLGRENRSVSQTIKASGRPTNHGGGCLRVQRDPQLAMKVCSGTCGLELPLLTEFYRRDRDSADGHVGVCRECQKSRQREQYRRNRKLSNAERRGRPPTSYDLERENTADTEAVAIERMMRHTPFLERIGPMSSTSIFGRTWRRE